MRRKEQAVILGRISAIACPKFAAVVQFRTTCCSESDISLQKGESPHEC